MKGFAVLQGCIELWVVSYNANDFEGGSGLHAERKQSKRRGYHGIGKAEGAMLEEGIPLPPQCPDSANFLGADPVVPLLKSLCWRGTGGQMSHSHTWPNICQDPTVPH